MRVDGDAAAVVGDGEEPSAKSSTSIQVAWPATASSMELSITSAKRWCRAFSSCRRYTCRGGGAPARGPRGPRCRRRNSPVRRAFRRPSEPWAGSGRARGAAALGGVSVGAFGPPNRSLELSIVVESPGPPAAANHFRHHGTGRGAGERNGNAAARRPMPRGHSDAATQGRPALAGTALISSRSSSVKARHDRNKQREHFQIGRGTVAVYGAFLALCFAVAATGGIANSYG